MCWRRLVPDVRILTEAELRELVPLDLDAVDCVEAAFAALARGEVEMPPVMSLAIHENNGEVDAKTAHIRGAESFTVKISPGFYDNPKIGLPTTNGIMVVFSAKTGQVEALLLDNGYLTDTRTAAAGAVAARRLSRDDASRLCIIGSGAQARLQAQAIHLVRPLEKVVVWARNRDRARLTARDISDLIGVEAEVSEDVGQAVRESDIIVATTATRTPIVKADWLSRGQLVIAMGSDQYGKCEVEPEAIARADHYIPDRLAQTRVIGEAAAAIAAGAIGADAPFPELGDVIIGRLPELDRKDSLTICDLTGTGVQDTAIAALARRRAEEAGAGTAFSN